MKGIGNRGQGEEDRNFRMLWDELISERVAGRPA